MNSRIQILFIVVVFLFLIGIIHLLKKKKLDLKYTLLWIIATVVLLIVTIFPNIMYVISNLIGIETPINSALVLAGVFVIIILITITSIVSQLNRTVRVLVQEVALLEKRIRDLSNENKDGIED
ncbi:DUF2304 domain-containing protein [Clostridium sp. SHJSY1]|uniref:DUF2304 domain-containing protein n=1 Tax=Clostridium sp. SHJSY1 TaxID=2942483 RepID=UPI002874EAAF|nr:DUF2304 domain-containing protein [Clostridium sp. SHJSY1]MDS0525583.1 DUF2304 domain-containing protein [Clostridium sp. SHJSY1]